MERLREVPTRTAVWILITALAVSGQGDIIYVDDDAVGAADGSSWGGAYVYLQDALAAAGAGDEIRVAQGVYRPDRDSAHPDGTGDRDASFDLIEGVVIKGGFAGLGAVDPDARDIALYETILSGDLAGDDVPVLDPCDLLTEPTRDDNTWMIVTGGPCSRATGLDGLTICSGNGEPYRAFAGGGLFLAGERSWDGDDAPSCPLVQNCTFIGHRGSAGAVRLGDAYPEIVNCTFLRNAGRGIDVLNHLVPPDCGFVIRGCTFMENYAPTKDGGALYVTGRRSVSVVIEDSVFTDNFGKLGGAITLGSIGTASIVDCRFVRNTAKEGTVYITDEVTVNMESCLFSSNTADELGGAICLEEVDLSVVACTFVANAALSGSAVANTLSRLSNSGVASPSIAITNSILWDGGDEITVGEWAELDVTFSDVQGGWLGMGNIDVDPLFAAPGYWDANNTPDDLSDDVWIDGDYHLKSQAGRWDPNSESWVLDEVTSPCIDAGDPNTPIGDEPFPNGGIVNMGAYGGTTEASKSFFGWPLCETHLAGDINGDCKVDATDLLILVGQWTTPPSETSAITIVEPIDGTVFDLGSSDTIYIRAVVNDPDFVPVSVRFNIVCESPDGTYKGSFSGRSDEDGWYYDWTGWNSRSNPMEGDYAITVTASDTFGRTQASGPVVVTVEPRTVFR